MRAGLAVAVFVTAYLLIATERVHRVTAALAGAAGIVDNIPYVATTAPLVAGLVQAARTRHRARPCGGPSPSAPTSAATPRRSGPAPTWW